METTLQPSAQHNFRNNIANIEAIELALLGILFWTFGASNDLRTSGANFFEEVFFLFVTEGILFGSWAVYNAYIRIARAGGRFVDVGLWVVASVLTATFTFWCWITLDINRFFMSRLFYRGEAPVEYAWSARSKQIRKLWEQTHNKAVAQ